MNRPDVRAQYARRFETQCSDESSGCSVTKMASIDVLSRVQLGTSAILAVMGLAGLSSPSFASDLMFSLAALFGASALLGILAPKHSRGRGLLFGSVFLTALMVTYVYVVFRAGVPPGSKPTLTPWIPIAIALLAMTFAGLLAARITRNHTTGVSRSWPSSDSASPPSTARAGASTRTREGTAAVAPSSYAGVSFFGSRIHGVNVTPTSSPSGLKRRATVWPQGSSFGPTSSL
jgi:hypothetical protein